MRHREHEIDEARGSSARKLEKTGNSSVTNVPIPLVKVGTIQGAPEIRFETRRMFNQNMGEKKMALVAEEFRTRQGNIVFHFCLSSLNGFTSSVKFQKARCYYPP